MQERSESRVLCFSGFELDLQTGTLRDNEERIPLQEMSFQVLAALLEKPGELVTREELCQRLWGSDTFVEFEDNLNHAVSRLREALGDSASNPRFIETLPRRGYCFIAPIEEISTKGLKESCYPSYL
jgi:DNA-binding winged helix-turn-helix (wHTH) protein